MRDFFVNEEGQGLTEYALIIVIVSIVAFSSLKYLGENVKAKFSNVASKFPE